MRKKLAAILAIVALSGACKEADRDTGEVDADQIARAWTRSSSPRR